jgi:hypothetical protein
MEIPQFNEWYGQLSLQQIWAPLWAHTPKKRPSTPEL